MVVCWWLGLAEEAAKDLGKLHEGSATLSTTDLFWGRFCLGRLKWIGRNFIVAVSVKRCTDFTYISFFSINSFISYHSAEH